MALSVNEPSPEVLAMRKSWRLVDALMGGTQMMREAGQKLLPKQPREDDEDYQYRLDTATLFPAYARTVSVMAGKPFAKQITLSDNTPAALRSLCDDIDNRGSSLHTVAATVFEEAVAGGLCGVLVDYTRLDHVPRTRRDVAAAAARPYWVTIKKGQILGWKLGVIDGARALTQVRISESADVDDGAYGTRAVNRVRVLRPGSFELWEEATGGYQLIDEGPMLPLNRIPFVPFYGRKTGEMVGLPPMLDLAHLNIKHWQHQSDQDDSTRFASKRLLAMIGVDEEEFVIGSSYAMRLPMGADVKVVQGSAECVTVGRSELEALEAQMVQAGAELLVARPGARTATESANDAEANKSDLQRIVEAFEDGLDLALDFTARQLGVDPVATASLFKDFSAGSLSEATAQLLLSLQQVGVITKATLIREQQRRGILSPDIDPEAELDAVKEEGPALGAIGAE